MLSLPIFSFFYAEIHWRNIDRFQAAVAAVDCIRGKIECVISDQIDVNDSQKRKLTQYLYKAANEGLFDEYEGSVERRYYVRILDPGVDVEIHFIRSFIFFESGTVLINPIDLA